MKQDDGLQLCEVSQCVLWAHMWRHAALRCGYCKSVLLRFCFVSCFVLFCFKKAIIQMYQCVTIIIHPTALSTPTHTTPCSAQHRSWEWSGWMENTIMSSWLHPPWLATLWCFVCSRKRTWEDEWCGGCFTVHHTDTTSYQSRRECFYIAGYVQTPNVFPLQ